MWFPSWEEPQSVSPKSLLQGRRVQHFFNIYCVRASGQVLLMSFALTFCNNPAKLRWVYLFLRIWELRPEPDFKPKLDCETHDLFT